MYLGENKSLVLDRSSLMDANDRSDFILELVCFGNFVVEKIGRATPTVIRVPVRRGQQK